MSARDRGTSRSGTGSAAWLSQSALGVDDDSSSLGLGLGFGECFLLFFCFRCGECVLEDALEVLHVLRFLPHLFGNFFGCVFSVGVFCVVFPSGLEAF